MTTPVNANQLFLPSALQDVTFGPGGELITFDINGDPVITHPNDPASPFSINALNVTYDNSTSGLIATTVQDAIDELDTAVDNNTTTINNILGGTSTLSFLNLADTPAAYAGEAGNAVIVNATEDGLEFGLAPGGGGGGLANMEELILVDGVDYTAGGGGPDTFALPVDPGVIANVWVSFDGIDQFDGFTLGAAPDITFPGGIPVAVSQVRIKIGSTAAGGGGGTVSAAIDTATYLVTVDYNGTTDDILPVPTPPAGGENELFVFFDGIFQNNTSWALINGGNDIQFDAFIPATVGEVEIRQLVSGGAIPVYMDDAVYTDGVDYTAGGGAVTLTLPVDPQTIENVWIYYNGIHQYPDPLEFSVVGTDLNILNGVPAGISEIYVKVGTTAAATPFDIASLPAGTADDNNDLIAIADVDDTNTMKQISIGSFRQLLGPADFVSTDQVWANSGGTQVTVAHGLGAVPSLLQINWVCIADEAGYVAGDVVQYVAGSQENPGAVGITFRGYVAYADNTNVNVVIGNGGVALPNTATGANDSLNSANWRVRVLAWY